MVTELHNASIISISKSALLKFLDFEGGVVHSVRENPEKWRPDEIEIVIEHPDLPEVREGSLLDKITPMYISKRHVVNVSETEAETYEKIERIDPPKLSEAEKG